MKYPKIVSGARAVGDDKKRLAEALATEIPPAKRGPKPEGEQTVEQHLKDAAAEIEAETGEAYPWKMLEHYRLVALWVSPGPGGNFPWAPVGWTAHREAYERGDSFAEFAANPAKVTGNNGLMVKDPGRRDALIAQAEADGVGKSKVLDVASNPKAVLVAIKADPTLAAAIAADVNARLAVHKADMESDSMQAVRRNRKAADAAADKGKDGDAYGHAEALEVVLRMKGWAGRPWARRSRDYVDRWIAGANAEEDAQNLDPAQFATEA